MSQHSQMLTKAIWHAEQMYKPTNKVYDYTGIPLIIKPIVMYIIGLLHQGESIEAYK